MALYRIPPNIAQKIIALEEPPLSATGGPNPFDLFGGVGVFYQ